MRRTFRGEHDCKVDSKGRLVIPSQLRPVIQNNDPGYDKGGQATIIVVFGGQRDRNLDCYTVTAADEVQERIDRLERGSPLRTVMEYDFNTCSDELMMDDTGRLVLPKSLRERIEIGDGGQIILKGKGDTFQMWHPDSYASHMDKTVGAARDALPAGVDPMLLLYQQTGG